MLKFLPLLCIAISSLVMTGCKPDGESTGRKAINAETAPVDVASDSSRSGVSTKQELMLPMVDAGSLSIALARAEEAFAAGVFEGGKQKRAGALEWYLAILLFDGENVKARTGLKNTVDALMAITRQTLRNGDPDEAARLIQVMKHSSASDPDIDRLNAELALSRQAGVWQKKAEAYEKQKRILATGKDTQPDYAVVAYRRALGIFPDYQPAAMAIDRLRSQRERAALMLANKMKFEAALIALDQAGQIDGENPQFRLISNHIRGRLNQLIREKTVLANLALDGLRIAPAEAYFEQAKAILPISLEVAALAKRLDEVKHYGRFKPRQVFTDAWAMSSPAPEMLVIPYGQFDMGVRAGLASTNPVEMPRHRVAFERGFAMAKNETTVAQFRQFIESSGFKTRATSRGWSMVFDEKGGSMTKRDNVDWHHDHLGRIAKEELPVVHVSFYDASAYAEWLSAKTGEKYRLPSEAEFEYVLKAGNDTVYPWGDKSPEKVVANLAGAGDKSTQSRSWGNAIPGYRDFHWGAAPVRSFPRENWGTFDLSGNVEEWVQDCWHDSYQRAPVDGSAWVNPGCKMGVTRGASWASSLNEARTGFRAATLLKTTNARIGFRVVREL